MRRFRGLFVIYFYGTLSPYLLLLEAICARVADLSLRFSPIIQSNLAPTVDSTNSDDVMSFAFVCQFVSNRSNNCRLSPSDTNLNGKGFLQGL
jgi:hypothetical protein